MERGKLMSLDPRPRTKGNWETLRPREIVFPREEHPTSPYIQVTSYRLGWWHLYIQEHTHAHAHTHVHAHTHAPTIKKKGGHEFGREPANMEGLDRGKVARVNDVIIAPKPFETHVNKKKESWASHGAGAQKLHSPTVSALGLALAFPDEGLYLRGEINPQADFSHGAYDS